MMDAARLRELAAQAAAHVGELDQYRTRRPSSPRSCARCTFWRDRVWTGQSLQKAPEGCDEAIIDGRALSWRVQIPRAEAGRCVCSGWVDNELAGFLHDGRAFDAIAVETRKPDSGEPAGGRDRLAALVRAQGGHGEALVIAGPQLIGRSIIDLQRQHTEGRRMAAPASPPSPIQQSDMPERSTISAREFVTAAAQFFAVYVGVGLVINVLSDGGAVSLEELFSPIGLSVVLIFAVLTTAALARSQ